MQVGNHSLNLTALYSAQKDTYDRARIYSRGFPTDVLTWYQPGSAEVVTPSRIYTQQSYISQMGRLFYSYEEKYLLTATFRRDGYSAFGSEKKFGVFPSVALGWNVKRESFLVDSDLLSQFKLRMSYGMNGNQAISPYSTLASVNRNDYLTGPNGDMQGVGFLPNSLDNSNLGWETTRSLNFGVDYGFYNNRIKGTIDVYKSNTKDLLLNRAISVINGVTSINSNIGEVENYGIEFLISTINMNKPNFEWTTDFNIAHNKNSIVDLYGDGKDDISNGWFIGKPIDVNFGYLFDGVWQLTDDIENSVQPNAKPGDVKIKDVDGDGAISPEDRTFIGQRSPKYQIGLTNTFRYKNFDFSFLITGRQGVTRINDLWDTDQVYADAIRNTIKLDWWSEDNSTNEYPANRDGANPIGVRFYKDASFIRLNNVNLSSILR